MGTRIALVGAGFLLVVAVFLLARPDDGPVTDASPTGSAPSPAATSASPEATPGGTVVDVIVADGAVTTPITAEVTLGDAVVLRVASDVADDVHLHGYDLETTVPAGGTGEIRFTADAPGVFEVEFHETGLLLLRLTVAP